MTTDLFLFALFWAFLAFVQYLVALPWLSVDYRLAARLWRWQTIVGVVVGCLVVGGGLAMFQHTTTDAAGLARWGRGYMSLLHANLAADLIVVIFAVALMVWPKGAAVALAAFREGIRQPMFWLLVGVLSLVLLLSPFIPYYTFGEDLKVLKELCFEFAMMGAALFAVTSASLSVTEEIEGRTAITLLSKPVSRRQFLIGKFVGLFLAASTMVLLLGWLTIWIVLLKQTFDPPLATEAPPDPVWIVNALSHTQNLGNLPSSVLRGVFLWIEETSEPLLFMIHVLCQVMVLTAIAVTLASRLPMVVNLVVCFVFYFLGNLANVLVDSTRNQNPLIRFVANAIENVFPTLDLFSVNTAVVRDLPLPYGEYAWHTLLVAGYALIYTTVALLIGLILFEDRDLA